MNHFKTGNSYFGVGSYVKYKFGRKKHQKTGMYDYGARMYMADIGRWFAADPMAESNPSLTPYRYGFNNPVMFTDPNGMLEQALMSRMWALGGTWKNTGDGFENDSHIKLGYDGNDLSLNTALDPPSGGGGGGSSDGGLPTMNIPGIVLTGKHDKWGQAFQDAFNAYMKEWNNAGSSVWTNSAAMGTVGVLSLPTGGGASAGTWTAIRGVLGGVLRAGLWSLPLMLNGDSSTTSTKVFNADITKRPNNNNQLYLYRNMLPNGNIPMLGQNRFTLGIRPLDIDGKTGNDYVYPSSFSGLSTTLGIGNAIPLNIPNKTDKTTLFRINAAILPSQGLIPAQIEGNYIRVIPSHRMTAQEFNLRIQLTAPLWTPIR